MDVKSLQHDEQLALVGLIEFLGESNAEVTEEEVQEIGQLAAELGRERFRALAQEVDHRFSDEAELKDFLETITRPEARELIYGIALEAALSDSDMLRHSEMLDWLRKKWNVSVEVD